MKTWDYIIIGIVALLSLLPLACLRGGADDMAVTVAVRGETVYAGSLSRDAVVQAGDGNIVTIADGHVRMTHADCPDGLCLRGEASRTHPLVCLPNGVAVTVSAGEEAYDARSY